MSIDLQDPISLVGNATQAVQRHAADAVDTVRSVDLPAPVEAVEHARRRARKAAKRLERRVNTTSKHAAKRVRAESRRVTDVTAPRRRGRRTLVVVLVVAGSAAVVALLAKRLQQVNAAETVPDPFGTAVRATEPQEHDGHRVTTG
jgi:hypothetical protein